MKAILFLIFSIITVSCQTTSQDPIITNTFNLGVEQMKIGEYHNAVRSFREVLKYNPSYIDAYNNLGIVYATIGESDLSEKTFLQALKIQPNNTQLKFNLGQLYKNLKRFLAAEKLFNEAIADEDFFDRPKVLYQLGELYENVGRTNMAISTLERAAKMDTSSCDTHFLLGKLYKNQRKLKEAVFSFDKASTGVCIRNRKAMLFLADTQYQIGNQMQARETWKKIVRLFSGESVAQVAQKKLNETEKKN